MSQYIKAAFLTGHELLAGFVANQANLDRIDTVAQAMVTCFESGHKVIICGNGGSSCDAMHFAEEFTGRFRKNRKPLPVIALSDSSHITCVGNDYGFEAIFSRGVEAYGKAGDMFIGLSTSGQSQNIINALEQAQLQGLTTCLLLGKDGGKCVGKADYEWVIPADTADRIQELHMMILHIIIETVERYL
ncbi:D-sedoheptulose 7-phosphate isomerase, partial [Candidatus Marinamargulisbacteria bacterium SCGC AG-414-C22]